MTLSYEESNLIAIYKKDTRIDTIREIAKITTFLSPDEGELMTLSESSIKKLKSMTDDEFDNLELSLDLGI